MARGYLYKLLVKHQIKGISIKTCGVMTPTGLLPTPETVQLLSEEGVDISKHRSHPLTEQMLSRADLILGMTPFHVQTAIRKFPACESKTELLKEYVKDLLPEYIRKTYPNTEPCLEQQIHDPMGGTLDVYKKAFKEIKDALNCLIKMPVILNPPKTVAAKPQFISQALNEAKKNRPQDKSKSESEKRTLHEGVSMIVQPMPGMMSSSKRKAKTTEKSLGKKVEPTVTPSTVKPKKTTTVKAAKRVEPKRQNVKKKNALDKTVTAKSKTANKAMKNKIEAAAKIATKAKSIKQAPKKAVTAKNKKVTPATKAKAVKEVIASKKKPIAKTVKIVKKTKPVSGGRTKVSKAKTPKQKPTVKKNKK